MVYFSLAVTGIHVNQIHKWKTQFLQDMPQIFEKQNKDLKKMKAEHEAQVRIFVCIIAGCI